MGRPSFYSNPLKFENARIYFSSDEVGCSVAKCKFGSYMPVIVRLDPHNRSTLDRAAPDRGPPVGYAYACTESYKVDSYKKL
jgi:hypothetical protein